MTKLNESQKRAKEQFEEMRRKLEESRKKHLSPTAEEERKRIERGGTNFSLFNYILETIDFTHCTSLMDTLREFYKRVYVHIKRVADENEKLRQIVYKNIEHLNEVDAKKAENIFQTQSDPNDAAEIMLNKVREDAKKRSKMGIKAYTNKDVPNFRI